MKKDLQEWAHFYGLKITDMNDLSVFPVNSVKAMRGAFVAQEHGKIAPYSQLVFETYWGANRDISKDEVLRDIVRGSGLDETEYFRKIATTEYKDKLKANTDRTYRARRLWLTDDFCGRRDVLRQRPAPASGTRPRA